MFLNIDLNTYNKIHNEAAKDELVGSYYFSETLTALSKCIDKKREYKHSISEINLGRKTLKKIIINIDDKKYVLKLTTKMFNLLFPKESKPKYKEPKETQNLFA